MWVSPRLRTGFSFRLAAGTPELVMDRLKEIGASVAPITDSASTFGFVKWSKAAKKAGLRPVFGVELGVTPSPSAKKPVVDRWTFLATDSLTPLNQLISTATEQFRYEPLLTYDQAIGAQGLIKIAGHATLLEHIRPMVDLFMGLSQSSPRGLIVAAKAAGFRFAAICDNRYPRREDEALYEMVCGRNSSSQTYSQHIMSEEEWREEIGRKRLADFADDAIANANDIIERSRAQLMKASLLQPEKPKTLREMCEEGAARLNVNLSDPVYAERLERELRLIAEKQFDDYFYIVGDLVRFARANMLVGPARGSSCGSLVCYLLGITTVDPIPHRLIFERFIDITRTDLPDIDIDFSDTNRHLVFEYVAEKYGKERVARLGTVANFKPRSALQEAGTALRIPKWKCDAVADSLIERSSGDSRALNTLEDTLREMPAGKELLRDHPEVIIVARMEGHPRNAGQHAAGVVISQEPISDVVAVDQRTGATMCDKYDAEEYGLLKIDALGLTQLSVFEDALALAGLPRDTLERIPMDDQAAFNVLNDRRFAGIFQFNGNALKMLTKQIVVDRFDDIVAITALARPGPLASGGANEWVSRRTGAAPVTYPHPVFEDHLSDTLGIVIYQEQVMEIGRHVGDLSWDQVTALRKAMSKSLGKEWFNKNGGEQWIAGAIRKGVAPETAVKVWDALCAYGSWSFNKSHAVAYGLISYQCCWLKAHYPLEFIAATLSHEGDPARQIALLRDIVAEGYDYVPVDADLSTDRWTVGEREGKRILVGPLSGVKGIGPAAVKAIIGARARGEPPQERYRKMLEKPVTAIDSLWPVRDAIKEVCPDLRERNIFTEPSPVDALQDMADGDAVLVVGCLTRINPRDKNEAVLVARRNGQVMNGQTAYINLTIADDSGEAFAQISTRMYESLGKPILDRGGAGKVLYALKGKLFKRGDMTMLMVNAARYLGDMKIQM